MKASNFISLTLHFFIQVKWLEQEEEIRVQKESKEDQKEGQKEDGV